MLNARMSQSDPRLYNPNRDVAHNFGFAVAEVATAIEQERWDALAALAVEKGITPHELGLACQALCKFVFVQADNPKESMATCLARCGFLDLEPTARIVVMAYLGQITLGMHWAGVREATLGGTGPAQTYRRLAHEGRRCRLLMTMPRWKRRLYLLKARIGRAWRALSTPTVFDAQREKGAQEDPGSR